MKIRSSFLVFCFYICGLGAQSDFSIVFVHIGPNLPHYALDALKQARMFNKSCEIYLLASQKVAMQHAKHLEQEKITLVPLNSLKQTKEHADFLRVVPKSCYWRLPSERFLVLYDFLSQYRLENVFHLENDNLLYVDLETKLSVFQQFYPGKIGAVFDNDQRCLPGFIYIANKNAMSKLAEYFVKYSKNMSDMQIPAVLKRDCGTKVIDHLPLVFPEYVQNHRLVSPWGHKAKDPQAYVNHFAEFDSIFDAAALGQYLGGIDPIHNQGNTVGFINESAVINPSLCGYKWILDDQQRAVPMITYKRKQYRINNLHIHSKALSKFASWNQKVN